MASHPLELPYIKLTCEQLFSAKITDHKTLAGIEFHRFQIKNLKQVVNCWVEGYLHCINGTCFISASKTDQTKNLIYLKRFPVPKNSNKRPSFVRVLGSIKPGIKKESTDQSTKTSIPSNACYIVVVKWQSMNSFSPTAYQSQVDVAHAQILKFA